MVKEVFAIDPRIVGDSVALAEAPLSHVRLMDDDRYPWLVLLPRRPGLVELTDLEPVALTALMEEVRVASAVLKAAMPFEKLNIGALGNVVSQLHVHVVGRRQGDSAWPGPVWGVGQRQPRGVAEAAALVGSLRAAFRTAGWQDAAGEEGDRNVVTVF